MRISDWSSDVCSSDLQPAEIADLVGVKAFQIQAASAAVFAPDGKRLASVVCDPARIGVVDDPNISDQTRSSANAPYGSLGCDIWIYPVSGGKKKNLTEAKGSNWSPAWSPDGDKLAFHSDRDGVPGVWVWNRSEERRGGKEWVSKCRSRWSPCL